ncbi:uncharacterized protein J4E79_011599 [Alternaria viburni]|uniref:uncharacterized protein n=1 Tax=Alternaria viburni TaxID=566460 RepID=UPI0020C4D3B7|nr:uncharacterized protein J4E79_011599 [Alternaria viburni]KAI4641828.1 hypothetical protein J4E79_011599 [Alternaria viburni]
MSGAPRGNRGNSNGRRARSSTNFGFREIGRGSFNNTLNGGALNTFEGGRGRGVGNGLPIRGMGRGTRRENSSSASEQDAQIDKDWFEENQVPKGPKADQQKTEEVSAVPQGDAHRDNQQLIPREPKADRLAKSRQVDTKLVPEQDAHIKNEGIEENQQSIPTEPKADRLARNRQAEARSVPEQDARPEDEQIEGNQHRIPTGPRADRLANSWQTEIEQDLYRDAARRAYVLLRPSPKHPRRESIHARPIPTHSRSRSPEEEREFLSSFPPLPSSPAANPRPPPLNQPPPSVTTSAAPSARPARREACSTNPTERTFRKVSAASMSTPSGSTEEDDGNLYDPDKTEEEKEKIRQEINEHNRGLLDPPWSGPSLGSEMEDIQRG